MPVFTSSQPTENQQPRQQQQPPSRSPIRAFKSFPPSSRSPSSAGPAKAWLLLLRPRLEEEEGGRGGVTLESNSQSGQAGCVLAGPAGSLAGADCLICNFLTSGRLLRDWQRRNWLVWCNAVSKWLTRFLEFQFCSVVVDDDQKITDQAVMCNQLQLFRTFCLHSTLLLSNGFYSQRSRMVRQDLWSCDVTRWPLLLS